MNHLISLIWAGTPELAIVCFCAIYTKKKQTRKNIPNSRLSGISCSLYPDLKVIPSSTEIENFKSNLQEINGKLVLVST